MSKLLFKLTGALICIKMLTLAWSPIVKRFNVLIESFKNISDRSLFIFLGILLVILTLIYVSIFKSDNDNDGHIHYS